MIENSKILTFTKTIFRQFFEELGPIKVKEVRPKPTIEKTDEEFIQSEEKVNLWLPSYQTMKNNEKKRRNPIEIKHAQTNISSDTSKEITDLDNYNNNSTQNGFSHLTLDKKTNLMTELFGAETHQGDSPHKNSKIESLPLKPSLKTSNHGSNKSVKFIEDKDE